MTAWESLLARKAQHTLPHALLLTSGSNINKLDFARSFSQLLLCKTGNACGICHACALFSATTHPDYRFIEPTDHGQIKIDQIRELVEALSQTAQQGAYRVVVINQADRLNPAAANALLKTLEEPGQQTVLMLLTERPSLILPTLRSRCQLFNLDEEKQFQIENVSELQNKIENLLQQFLNQPASLFDVVKVCLGFPLSDVIFAFQQMLVDVVAAKLGANRQVSEQLVNHASLNSLFDYYDFVLELRKQIDKHINLNANLVLESLFLKFP